MKSLGRSAARLEVAIRNLDNNTVGARWTAGWAGATDHTTADGNLAKANDHFPKIPIF